MNHNYLKTRLSVMMFLQFVVIGAWFVTLGNFMGRMGWGKYVGLAYSVGPVASIISPFFLGMVADRFFASEKMLCVLNLLGGVALLAVPYAASVDGSVSLFIILLLVHMTCFMPCISLLNSLCFHNLPDREKDFSIVRAFGTVGWIFAGVLVSRVLHADELVLPFYIGGAASVVTAIYSLTLPHTPPPAKGEKISWHNLLCLDSLALLKKRSFLVFMVMALLISIPLAVYNTFAPIFVKEAGLTDPAYQMSFGQIGEVILMFLMPFFFLRVGIKKMLLISMIAWAARYAFFAFGGDAGLSGLIFAGILVQGICYNFFYITGQVYVDKEATKGIRGQAQGFYFLITQGWGMLFGTLVAGWLFNLVVENSTLLTTSRWKVYWLIPSITTIIIMMVFGVMFKEKKKHS